jgi:transglutaminase-like putative cysteine protease
VITALLAALACLPAVLIAGSLFDGLGYLAPLAGAVALAGALAWLVARRLRGGSLVCLTGIAGGLAYATALTMATGGSAGLAARALRDGWPRLLSVALPARPVVALLVPLGAIVWMASFAAVALAARTAHPLAPALPPLLGLAATLVLVGHGGAVSAASRLLLSAVTVALVLAAAALRSGPVGVADGAARGPARARPSGPAAFGLVVVAAVAVVGTAAGLLIPVGPRYDPRDHYHPPMNDVALLNPLGMVRTQLEADPARTVFTVTLDTSSGKPPTDRIAVAELGDFDGATWTDDTTFVLVDHTLPTKPATPVSTVGQIGVRATVRLDSAMGDLLPTVGHPAALAGASWDGSAYDPVSGTLAALTAPRAGASYTLTAQVPAPTDGELAHALPATGPSAAPYLALPTGLPASLRAIATQATASASTPYAKLQALAAYLRDDGRFPYDLAASPGHSYGVLRRFLTGTDPGDQRGYAEQHAAAFAVLARALGFPTRISVGYLLDEHHIGAGGAFTVTTSQAHAWPEVLLGGIGWVSFEPTDVSQLTKVLPPPPAAAVGGTPTAPTAASRAQPPLVAPQLDHKADQGTRGGSGGGFTVTWPMAVGLVMLLLLLGVPVLVAVAKARRRGARRRRGSPVARVDGAWNEARDRLSEYGVPRAPAWSHREVVAAVAATPGLEAAAEPLARLAVLADQARYWPAAAEAGGELAPEAWRQVAEIRGVLRQAGGTGRRLRAALSPRALLPVGRSTAPLPEVPLAARGMVRAAANPAEWQVPSEAHPSSPPSWPVDTWDEQPTLRPTSGGR